MNNIWFTSDTHFGHANILTYENIARPFKDLHEMSTALIERWNSVIKPNDTVYHLGDFCFGRANMHIAELLNGKKRLILGNHDTYPINEYMWFFDRIYGAKMWEKCILTHIPVHPSTLKSRWLLNVHGHTHSRQVPDEGYFNVSVECHNLTPVHADIIRDAQRKFSEVNIEVIK